MRAYPVARARSPRTSDVRHFLAVLGAAHGGVGAALIAAAFLPSFVRPLFACVTLAWYAVLGPLAEAIRLDEPPSLWDAFNCCFAGRGFSSADVDADGHITREEWADAQRKGVISKKRSFDDVLHKVDKDGDGRVSLAEFKALQTSPTLNFGIINCIMLIAIVGDTGLRSAYTIAALSTMGLGLLIFLVTVSTKSSLCKKRTDDDEEDDDEVDEED